MIIAVVLAGWDYSKYFLFLLFPKFSEKWDVTFEIKNVLIDILK